jgi:hypothetical protein
MRLFATLLAFVFLLAVTAGATEVYYRTLSNLNCRPLGMGGAFLAVPCEFEAALYNPASFVHGQGFGGALNLGLTLYWLARGFGEEARLQDVELGGAPGSDFATLALTTLVGAKALSYSVGGFYAFCNLWEESFADPETFDDPHFFHVKGLWSNRSNTLGVGYRFREGVCLAASGSYYSREYPVAGESPFAEGGAGLERRSGYGFTVGATWEFVPDAYAAATYVDLPDGLPGCRANLEGLGDESLNVGAAWFPFPDVVFSLDVRNLVNSRSEAFREVRVGLDQRLLPHLTFRAGYAYTGEQEHLWSLGLGVGDGLLGAAGGIETNLAQSNYILNYALVKNQTADEVYHLLSFIVTF